MPIWIQNKRQIWDSIRNKLSRLDLEQLIFPAWIHPMAFILLQRSRMYRTCQHQTQHFRSSFKKSKAALVPLNFCGDGEVLNTFLQSWQRNVILYDNYSPFLSSVVQLCCLHGEIIKLYCLSSLWEEWSAFFYFYLFPYFLYFYFLFDLLVSFALLECWKCQEKKLRTLNKAIYEMWQNYNPTIL